MYFQIIGTLLILFFTFACSSDTPSAPDETDTSTAAAATANKETTTAMTEGTEPPSAEVTASTTETTTSETPTSRTENNHSPTTNSKPAATTSETKKTTEPTPPKNTPSTTKTSTTNNKSTTSTKSSKPMRPALSHELFNGLLQKYVDRVGNVDYSAFKRSRKTLEEYLDVLKANPPKSNWTKNKEMAYWINLYNAFTIHTIVKNYPVNSIMDIDNGKVWDTQKINIGGSYYTLNQMEKDKLLKRFKEPRVHFAVNCGAASCPPLLNRAWTEGNIQHYYDAQAKSFINNSNYNELSPKLIKVSKIFSWYASDFGGSDKIVPYFQKYATTTIKDKAKVKFKEYDWKLNKQ